MARIQSGIFRLGTKGNMRRHRHTVYLCVVFVCFGLALCSELRCLLDHGRDVIVVQVPAVDGSIGSAHSNLMKIRQRQLAL